MAKKAQAEEAVEVAPQPVAKKIVTPKKPIFEFKDRTYILKSGKSPVIYTVASRHSAQKPLLYFDKEQGYNRELRYATNQKSCFKDEQKGTSTLGRIVFKDGKLNVKKENVVLQKLLSLYHPAKDRIFYEFNPVQVSENQLDWIELELDALNLAKSLNIDEAEAIMRVEMGERILSLSSAELKRDLMIFAKNSPALFINLATDENVQLRNTGAKAVEQGILKLSDDQRTFYYGSTNRKLMTVPFDEHPYSALAAYFKTDEGMEVYKAVMKKL